MRQPRPSENGNWQRVVTPVPEFWFVVEAS
jgi:hypothetical protein